MHSVQPLVAMAVGFLLTLYLEPAEGIGCDPSQVVGIWTIERSLTTTDDFSHCYTTGSKTITHTIALLYPDHAVDEYGSTGHWTIVWGYGLEITIHGRKYYSYFAGWWLLDCNRLWTGSSRDILTNNYACFNARKRFRAEGEAGETQGNATTTPHPPTFLHETNTVPTDIPTLDLNQKVEIDYDLIDRINNNGLKLWEAEPYEHLKDMKLEDLVLMAGGNVTRNRTMPNPAPYTPEQLAKLKDFPKSFDWRNVNGQSYVSPVRNQGYCGSCYAFAAAAAYETRIRIITNNTLQPMISTQDIVSCSPYSYGCWGGLIFTEGKYAEEFGFTDESCQPYSATNERCIDDKSCRRYFGTRYQYVGGYFGGSNDILMMETIYENGPVVVGFAVHLDFVYYRRGVYYHSAQDRLLGYHAVIVVGWGQDDASGTRYWIVKNSWGSLWGEDGYFRIVRGRNEVSLEAEAFEFSPIL